MTPAYFHDARVPRAATSLALALGITLVIACGTQEHPASPKDLHADWVGSEACRSCHPKEFEDWKGSHH
ncbi:MAG: cytochrome c family protein, partial [Planctomycetes bacterium]|nr:cytochrome c family protein [Planctomycetota bacterium]